MGERLVVDQVMCDMARLMMAGGGSQVQVAKLLEISESTLSRIKAAGFSAEQFMRNKEARRLADKVPAAERAEEKAELPGQVKMELVYDQSIAEEYRQEQKEENSMMRFQAKQAGLIMQKMEKKFVFYN